MKKLFLIPALLMFSYNIAFSQKATPEILIYPEDWSFERIDFPLSFAPEINYKGFEELRFSPGMFNNASDEHFTYIIMMNIEEKVKFTETDINALIYNYFEGLCTSYAEKKKLVIDTAKIISDIKKIKGKNYTGTVQVYDVFNKGELLTVNVNLSVINNKSKTVLFICFSKQNFDNEIWTKMTDAKGKCGF